LRGNDIYLESVMYLESGMPAKAASICGEGPSSGMALHGTPERVP
jgi:hypothetical protein